VQYECSLEILWKGFAKKQQLASEGAAKRVENNERVEKLKAEIATKKESEETLKCISQHSDAYRPAALEKVEGPETAAKAEFDKAWEGARVMVLCFSRVEKSAAEKEQNRVGLFATLDQDQNGVLTVDDLVKRAEFDTDKDGTVTVEEAEAYLDRDGDGAVNASESGVGLANFDTFLAEAPSDIKVEPHRKTFSAVGGHVRQAAIPRGNHSSDLW
jgi:hypothetical protein